MFYLKVDADLGIDSRLALSVHSLASIGKSTQVQTMSGSFGLEFRQYECALCSLESSVAREVHGRELFHEDRSLFHCMTIKTCNTIVMEQILICKSCFSFHPDTGAHDKYVTAVREELNLQFFYQLMSLAECGHFGNFTCYCSLDSLISCVIKKNCRAIVGILFECVKH